MNELLLIAILLISSTALVLCIILMLRQKKGNETAQIDAIRREISHEFRASRTELSQIIGSSIKALGEASAGGQEVFQKTIRDMIKGSDERFANFALQNEQKLETIRQTVQNRLMAMQEDNAKKLNEMRATVDEKLQKTLESRITESFKVVSERLEQVYKGLGEMQVLARGVGDLQKVLSNVKTRGIMGEIQLGAILENILSPDQYVKDFNAKPGSREVVEYAIKLPGSNDAPVYLPIDAKFPADAYSQLQDAYDTNDVAQIDAAVVNLRRTLIQFAKDIHNKYINPPLTTDFAILFLPFEGLYAEVVRRGLIETLQRDYKINISGPSTTAALLNSLQMGFQTLAIQKRSGEVWEILGAVKMEFDTFEKVLKATQQRLDQANGELEKLVGVRTRQIQRKLKSVTELPESNSAKLKVLL